MSVRIRYRVEVVISSSSAEEKDLGNLKYEVVNDEQNEGGTWKTTLAAAAVNTQLQLGNVASAKFVMIRTASKDPTLSPVPVFVRLNSPSGEQIEVTPVGAAKEGIQVLTSGGITALYASNPGSVAMDVIVAAAGD